MKTNKYMSFLTVTRYKSNFIADCAEDGPFPKDTDKAAGKSVAGLCVIGWIRWDSSTAKSDQLIYFMFTCCSTDNNTFLKIYLQRKGYK